MKLKRGSKGIGRRKKGHSKRQSSASDSSTTQNVPPPTVVYSEHSYVSKDSVVQDSCGFIGPSFASCDCILHEIDDCMPNNSDGVDQVDSDDLDTADQFFVIYGTGNYEYKSSEDIALVTFNLLRQEAVQHEHDINKLGFSIAKTTDKLHFIKLYERESVTVSVCLTVNLDLSPLITVHGKPLQDHDVYKNISSVFILNDLYLLMNSISEHVICCGNPDTSYIKHYGFKGDSFLEGNCGASYQSTIRSNSCSLLTRRTLRCEHCMRTRRVLGNKELRISKQEQSVSLSSTRPNSSMSRTQLEEKSKLLKNKVREMERKKKRLQAKAALEKLESEEELSEEDTQDIQTLVKECSPNLETVFPDPDSFERIFWEEQLKYNKLKSKASMRWHPLIIKWALLIKSKSSKAYQTMREQGFIHLPSERTLYDYSHFLPSTLGFVPEVVDKLVEECKLKGMFKEEWSSYVGILQDEVKVKDDLIYCATTGQLIGYVNLDDTSNAILDFERGKQRQQQGFSNQCTGSHGSRCKFKFEVSISSFCYKIFRQHSVGYHPLANR